MKAETQSTPRPPSAARRALPFLLLGAVLQMGLAMGISAADSLFIAEVGAEKLPVVYALTPLMMIAYIRGYTQLLTRFGITFVFRCTLGVLAVGGVGLGLLLAGGGAHPPALLYGAKFYAVLWYIALYSLLWNYVDGFFNLSDAKQVFGYIAGGAAIGAIVGGGVVSTAHAWMPVAAFFYLWAGTALLAWPLLQWIERKVPKLPAEEALGEGESAGIRVMIDRIRGNRYVLVLTLLIFTTLVTATLCEFRYMTIFDEQLRTAEELATLFGRLYAGVNGFNLLFTLLLFNRLVSRFGVRNLALVQPVVYLAVFSLMLLDGGMLSAMIGFLAYQGIMTSLDYNNINLLFNAMPEQGKKETRTAIEGICEPVATAVAGVFLLWAQGVFSAQGISLFGFGLAAICLGSAVLLRQEFVRAVTENVRRSWIDFGRQISGARPLAPEETTGMEGGVANRLRLALRRDELPSRRAALAELATQPARLTTVLLPELLAWFGASGEAADRIEIVSTLARANDGATVSPLLQRVVSLSPDERRAVEQLLAALGPRAIPGLVQVLREPRFTLAARSVAARGVARISPVQLDDMLPGLMENLIDRLYTLTACRYTLAEATSKGVGHEGLLMVYRDLPSLTMELGFEFLSVAGRLPGYESIVAALHSGGGKEWGFALESIEQACGRKLFARFRPFLDGRADAEVVRAGEALGLVGKMTVEDVVARSLRQAFPFEVSAALQAAVEADPKRCFALCQEVLQRDPPPMVRETVRRLMLRHVGRREADKSVLTPAERFLRFREHAACADWGVRAMELLADELEETTHAIGETLIEAGAANDRVGFAPSGTFTFEGEGGSRSATGPLVIGREAMGEVGAYRETVRALTPGRVTWVRASKLRSCVFSQPRIGLELLRWKMRQGS